MPKAKKRRTAQSIHRLEISIDGSKPRIWRRVEVLSTIRLQQLHHVIQHAMGWDDAHFFQFRDQFGESPPDAELQSVAPDEGATLTYVYDFGDLWLHEVVVNAVVERKNHPHPRCTAGGKACPPEDCGGIDRYRHLMAASASTRRRDGMIPPRYKPDEFDKAAANARLVTLANVDSEPDDDQPIPRPSKATKRAGLYHRVSTTDQDPTAAQRELHDAANRYGMAVTMDVEETGSGANNNRPGLQSIMEAARRGKIDAVIVWKLDRFGRSALDLVANLRELESVGVRFVAITQGLDIRPGGDATSRLMLTLLGAIAEFEREPVVERTHLGLAKAREEGKRLGRSPTPRPPPNRVAALRRKGRTWAEVAKALNCTVWAARQAEKGAVKGGQDGRRKRARRGPSEPV